MLSTLFQDQDQESLHKLFQDQDQESLSTLFQYQESFQQFYKR
jgi:hypothetical protein